MTRSAAIRAAGGLAFLTMIALAAIAARLPRVREFAGQILAMIETAPAGSVWLFCGAQVLVAACGLVPAAVMAVAAGAFYGLAGGLAISVACTLLGGWLSFCVARSAMRPFFAFLFDRFDTISRLDSAVSREGWKFVCLLRISPVMPFAATSYGLGLTEIRQRDFLLGTLASIPSMAGYVALGAMGMESVVMGQAGAGPLQFALLAVGIATVLWAIARVRKLMADSLAIVDQ